MSLVKYFKPFWSFATILSILGLGFAIYTEYYKPSPEITLNRVASVNAFEINQATQKLKIFLNDQKIDPQSANIAWEKISIVNTGTQDITQNMFANDEAWGIEIVNGEIIDINLIQSNEKYLQEKVKVTIKNGKRLILPKVIFDKGKSISFELIVKHSSKELPAFHLFGKISGIDFKYKDDRNKEGEKSFLSEVFSGSPLTQFSRAIFYSLLFVLGASCSIFLGFLVNEALIFTTRPLRASNFNKLIRIDDYAVSLNVLEYLRNYYIEKGKQETLFLQNFLCNPRSKTRIWGMINRDKTQTEKLDKATVIHNGNTIVINDDFADYIEEITYFNKQGLIITKDKTVEIDENLLNILATLTGKISQ